MEEKRTPFSFNPNKGLEGRQRLKADFQSCILGLGVGRRLFGTDPCTPALSQCRAARWLIRANLQQSCDEGTCCHGECRSENLSFVDTPVLRLERFWDAALRASKSGGLAALVCEPQRGPPAAELLDKQICFILH